MADSVDEWQGRRELSIPRTFGRIISFLLIISKLRSWPIHFGPVYLSLRTVRGVSTKFYFCGIIQKPRYFTSDNLESDKLNLIPGVVCPRYLMDSGTI